MEFEFQVEVVGVVNESEVYRAEFWRRGKCECTPTVGTLVTLVPGGVEEEPLAEQVGRIDGSVVMLTVREHAVAGGDEVTGAVAGVVATCGKVSERLAKAGWEGVTGEVKWLK